LAPKDRRIPEFIDSHAHLADPAFAGESGEVIERARATGARAIVCVGSGSGARDPLAAAAASSEIARRFPSFVWYSAGVHPHDASSFDESVSIPRLRDFAANGAIAIGECGLDYHYDNSPRAEQRQAFSAQIDLAAQLGLPVIVHTREAEPDTVSTIGDAESAGVRGVLHCFTGSAQLAERAIQAGWYISFSGIVTFRKWTDDDLLRMVPDDRILAESDSPYLAPVPHRGKRNEPAWVTFTVARLAAARGTTTEKMGTQISLNAAQLFKLAALSDDRITFA
jgi:TatD DNase family protein